MKQPGPLGRVAGGLLSVLTALLLTYAGTASAQTTGIAATRHNLGSATNAITGRNQVTGTTATTGTAEICVFCHTPHGGDTAAPAPLWNKRLGVAGAPAGGGTYTTYASLSSPSIDGAIAAVGSISMACLSCHDGTQAMDNIINAPGSGGVLADGGAVAGLGYTWAGATVNTTTGALQSGPALLGTNLSNDHPIGIQYCGGGITGGSGTTVTGACRDQDFVALQTNTINSSQVFWVDTGGLGKQRTDLPLYTRGGSTAGPMVECGSCHDPHVSTGQAGPTSSGGRVAGETFLRISNASSAVCTACHVK
jgi:hypothetical protein